MQLAFKVIILLAVLTILASLAQAMYYLVKDQGASERTVRALSWRVGASLGLMLLLFIGYSIGLIEPHSVQPGTSQVDAQPSSSQEADSRR